MATQLISSTYSIFLNHQTPQNGFRFRPSYIPSSNICITNPINKQFRIRCSKKPVQTVRTCKNCKTQFDPLLNNPRACRHHTSHFGGETKRKFESVHSGGTMNTPESGKVFQYWHCCGSEDPFDIGCTASPHSSYDD